MQRCTQCRCAGRTERVITRPDGDWAQLICPNPRCTGYRQIFAEAWLGGPQTDEAHADKIDPFENKETVALQVAADADKAAATGTQEACTKEKSSENAFMEERDQPLPEAMQP